MRAATVQGDVAPAALASLCKIADAEQRFFPIVLKAWPSPNNHIAELNVNAIRGLGQDVDFLSRMTSGI